MYSQIKQGNQVMIKKNYKYGEKVEINMNEEGNFDDSLSIILTSFSHKRPYTGGATKATAYITLSKGNISANIMLSIHGTDGVEGIESYDSLIWNDYTFQLNSFNYDSSVGLTILKNK